MIGTLLKPAPKGAAHHVRGWMPAPPKYCPAPVGATYVEKTKVMQRYLLAFQAYGAEVERAAWRQNAE